MVLVWIFAINMAQNIYTINIVKSFVFLFFIFTLNRLVEKYKYIVYAPFTRPRTHYQWFYHHALHFNLVTIFLEITLLNLMLPHPSQLQEMMWPLRTNVCWYGINWQNYLLVCIEQMDHFLSVFFSKWRWMRLSHLVEDHIPSNHFHVGDCHLDYYNKIS